jgi:hypothetical protein
MAIDLKDAATPEPTPKPRFRIAVWACALIVGTGMVGGGLTAASATTAAHLQRKPTKAEQALIKHVPSSYADSCSGDTAKWKKLYAGVIPAAKKQTKSIGAAVICAPSGGSVDTVVFTQWKKAVDMNAFYRAVVADFNVEPNSTHSQNGQPTACPTERAYQSGAFTGRFVCQHMNSDDSAELYWTNEELRIIGDASLKPDPDGSRLYAWWNADSGGLIAASSSTASSSPPGTSRPSQRKPKSSGIPVPTKGPDGTWQFKFAPGVDVTGNLCSAKSAQLKKRLSELGVAKGTAGIVALTGGNNATGTMTICALGY